MHFGSKNQTIMNCVDKVKDFDIRLGVLLYVPDI